VPQSQVEVTLEFAVLTVALKTVRLENRPDILLE
jgi:hypothetical protein